MGGGSLGTLLIKFLNIKELKNYIVYLDIPSDGVGNEARKFKDTNDQQDIFDVIFGVGSETGINDCIN